MGTSGVGLDSRPQRPRQHTMLPRAIAGQGGEGIHRDLRPPRGPAVAVPSGEPRFQSLCVPSSSGRGGAAHEPDPLFSKTPFWSDANYSFALVALD